MENNTFEFQRKQLKKKLANIAGLTGGRDAFAGTASVLFEIINGKCSIKATDLKTGLKQSIDVISPNEAATCCADKIICEIIKEVESETLTFALNDKHILLVAGKGKFKIPCYPVDNFPLWPDEEKGGGVCIINGADLASCLKKAIPFTDRNKHDIKNCVLLEVSPDNLKFVSTDGYRLAMIVNKEAKTDGVPCDRQYLFPASSASEIINFLSGKEEEAVILLGEKHVIIRVKNEDELYVRLFEPGSYPEYKKIIRDYSNDAKMFVNKEALIKALKRVSILSTQKAVKFVIKENLLTLYSSSDIGEATEEVEVVYTPSNEADAEFKIAFNFEFILDILRAASPDDMIFHFSGARKPAYIKGSEDELFVVMPMIL